MGPSLDDLKRYLNISTTSNDDELLDMLDAAVEVTESIIGPIGGSTVTETHYGLSTDVLVLRQAPAIALTSVTAGSAYGGSLVVYTLTDYLLDDATATVRLANGGRFRGDLTVTYTTGRSDLPAAARLAILIIAGHLWETQRGAAPASPMAARDSEVVMMPGRGFAIPNRAKELLDPFVMPRGVA